MANEISPPLGYVVRVADDLHDQRHRRIFRHHSELDLPEEGWLQVAPTDVAAAPNARHRDGYAVLPVALQAGELTIEYGASTGTKRTSKMVLQ
jgi:hypothetical protein